MADEKIRFGDVLNISKNGTAGDSIRNHLTIRRIDHPTVSSPVFYAYYICLVCFCEESNHSDMNSTAALSLSLCPSRNL